MKSSASKIQMAGFDSLFQSGSPSGAEAAIILVDSNLQREKLLPSEKAWAYKMRLEAIQRQGERRDLTLARGVPQLNAREQIAQNAGEKSGMAVTRYISLTKLIPPLLALADDGKLSVSTAADYLSNIPAPEQHAFLNVMEQLDISFSVSVSKTSSCPPICRPPRLRKIRSQEVGFSDPNKTEMNEINPHLSPCPFRRPHRSGGWERMRWMRTGKS